MVIIALRGAFWLRTGYGAPGCHGWYNIKTGEYYTNKQMLQALSNNGLLSRKDFKCKMRTEAGLSLWIKIADHGEDYCEPPPLSFFAMPYCCDRCYMYHYLGLNRHLAGQHARRLAGQHAGQTHAAAVQNQATQDLHQVP